MRDIKTFLANLSHHPGVYQMLDAEGKVIYVGKAKNLKKRITSYFRRTGQDLKTQSLVQHIHDIDITVTHTENEAVLLECNLIKQHRPRYNILLRDDKSYPYISITTQHPYPRIELYRGRRKKEGSYFGPYPSALAARETISLLEKLFHLRTCSDDFYRTRSRPCLLYQIGRCSGPCVGLIPQEEYRRNIQAAILFLEGKSDTLIHLLQERMEIAGKELNFELAAHYRDQINRLRQIQEKQYVNVDDGNADIIGFAAQAGMVCIQLLSIRHGQLLGSRSYFPVVPLHSSQEEIIDAFLTQHYLHTAQLNTVPKHILADVALPERSLLENVLTEQAKHKVTIMQPLRGEKKKWLQMAMTSAKQSLVARLFQKANMQERANALQSTLKVKKLRNR